MLTPDRRQFLRATGAAVLVSALSVTPFARAFAADAPTGPYSLPPLPYDPTALEPHIDAATMGIHHGKHHAAYVANLNKALADHGDLAKLPLEELLAKVEDVPEAVRKAIRNNGGGHANHSMFWQIMGPAGGPEPDGDLKAAIDRALADIKADGTYQKISDRYFGQDVSK